MSLLRLYHGSEKKLETPQFGLGSPRNDYGLGFYCTEHLEMANEWAVRNGNDGVSNEYRFDATGLSVLDLNGEGYTILHWLAVLLQNRIFDIPAPLAFEARAYIVETFPVPYEKADVIRGYRADDSYFSFAQDFLNGTISLQQLERAMHLGNLGEQIVVKSKKAFNRLEFVGAEFVPAEIWAPARDARDAQARREYFDIERNRRQPSDLFIATIIDEGMDAHDLRLRP